MRVAIFCSAFYPSTGGVEELTRRLAHTYRNKGMEAIVLTNRWPRSLPTAQDYEGFPLYRVPFRAPMRPPEGDPKSRLVYALTHRSIRRNIERTLQRHRIELIHVQCVSVNGYYAHLASKALNLPLVVSAQGERTMDATKVYERSPFINQVLRDLLRDADYITACSQDTLTDIERYYGQPFGSRAEVVYNGVSVQEFTEAAPFASEKPYILGIGRMVPQKGFDVLLNAYAQANPAGYDLMLAGDGAERAALERQANELGVADRVRFPGRVANREAASLFKGCAFFVLPSRIEPMGIVNLEAMAAGKAVIASRTGGVPEIAPEGKVALLFPPGDSAALAQAITQLTQDTARREALAAQGRQWVQQFDWSALADQYIAIYQRILAARSLVPARSA